MMADQLDKREAERDPEDPMELFGKYLTVLCDDCDAKIGELCKATNVYVHFVRLEAYMKQRNS
jgi:hypothetical protein